MRISDWSSDVCSYDLVDQQGGPQAERDRHRQFFEDQVDHRPALEIALAEIEAGVILQHQPAEIGSAACRERVCQYVEIMVVAVSFKKKKEEDSDESGLIVSNVKSV